MITHEDSSVYVGHYEVETLIDRPVAQVWKQFLNIPSWVTSHRIENVEGIPGTVGSITRVAYARAKQEGLPPARYHYCRLIKVLPERQWLLRTYSEKGGSYGFDRLMGFDDGRVVAVGDKTRVIFNLFIEFKSEALAKQSESDFDRLEISREGMQKNLENLKHIVEKQPKE